MGIVYSSNLVKLLFLTMGGLAQGLLEVEIL